MAVTTSRAGRAVGIAGIATSCIIGLVIAPTVAHADPATDKASVQQQIVATQHEVEVVAEQYNDAKIKLTELNEAKAAAEAAAADANASLDAQQDTVAATGVSLYKSPALSDVTTIIAASTPQEIIDKLNMLAQISDHYGDTVESLKAGQSEASAAADAAEQAAADAAKTEQGLAAKKAEIESKLPDLEAQLASLTDAEREAVLAQSGGHAAPAADEGNGASSQSATPSTQSSASSTQGPAPSAQSAPNVSAGSGGSSTAQGAVNAALSRLGMPYVWAAAGPTSFDCSGLTMWAYGQVGVSLPHSSGAQAGAGTTVPVSAAAPGDILWMPGHVGMYIGNGQVVHAPTSGDVVKVVSVGSMGWQKAVRVA